MTGEETWTATTKCSCWIVPFYLKGHLRRSGAHLGDLRMRPRMLWLVAFTGLALFAQAKKLEGVEEQFEPLPVSSLQLRMVHRAALKNRRCAAVHAGDVVFVSPQRRKQGFAAGEMSATDLSPLLKLAQVPVYRCKPHWTIAGPQTGVQVLTRQLLVGILQMLDDQLLPLAAAGNLGRHALLPRT